MRAAGGTPPALACRVLEEQRAEKQRLREERRAERLERYETKRRRRLEEDPYASEPSSVSNSTFTLSDDDDGWLSSQAEMVLEPYFMSLDSTWNRLQAIGEYIDDTEDYVNITLDSHRNQLIQVRHACAPCLCRRIVQCTCESALLIHPWRLGPAAAKHSDTENPTCMPGHSAQMAPLACMQVDLLLTAATFCVGLVTLIAGLFGMNLFSGLDTTAGSPPTVEGGSAAPSAPLATEPPADAISSTRTFVLVSVLSCTLSIGLLIAFVVLMRWKQLAFI
jgi:hypothetical protein